MNDKLFGSELFFGSTIVLIFLSFWASQHQDWRKRTNSTRIVFRGPFASKLLLGGFGVWLILMPVLLIVKNIKDAEEWFLFSLIELVAGAMGGLFLAGAGARRELKLDVEHRTYQFIIGWGLWVCVHSEGLEDFDGTYIRCSSTSSTKIYRVGLTWRSGNPVTPTLGNFIGSGQAKHKADVLVAR